MVYYPTYKMIIGQWILGHIIEIAIVIVIGYILLRWHEGRSLR